MGDVGLPISFNGADAVPAQALRGTGVEELGVRVSLANLLELAALFPVGRSLLHI
jgi:hypothetical protein